MKEPREFYICETDYIQAWESCDLGDWRSVRIAFYPHKDDTPKMFHVREVIDNGIEFSGVFFDELQWAELAKYKALCEEMAEAIKVSLDAKTDDDDILASYRQMKVFEKFEQAVKEK